ncbi:PucR family transcriptional regulator [Actinocorallia populi]|uniref:PucR family transcriptional regulator n=1 Tax=Actinocorallia populi TaxID=2079200 RepID=UPI000D089ED7|nr:PucR family transcriptional regulator [Actinocorallia populi]
MFPTLASVVALPRLGLRPRTTAALDVPVRWVAVSELPDPTPFLEGGELVLTTGMRLAVPGECARYVARLTERGVAGLGFGVGLGHAEVPPELVEAAEEQGLPLLEVPRPTPFVAIGEAVSRKLAAAQYEDVTRGFQAQRELVRAALRGSEALVSRLARELQGWALLLGPDGEPRHAVPEPEAGRRLAEVVAELPRLRGGAASLALPGPIVVQQIGLGRPRGYLAVGAARPLTPYAHTIVGAAVSLLTLGSEAPRGDARLRAALGGLLLGREVAEPPYPLRVLLCGAGAARALENDPLWERCLAVPQPDGCVLIVSDPLVDQVIALVEPYGPVGVGDPARLADVPRSLAEAERARPASGVRRYAELPVRGLLGLLDRPDAVEMAERLLAPLDGTLRDSLRAYLEAGGQGDPAARALGVHRHTLRHRTRKISQLLDRDLEDAGTRAELWIALTLTRNAPF